ncbi:MAG TPA: tetratricopeptide repeat protein [Casimicrobiaceae bacterium]|nr:tetratricopeptide repeat protein [Casimicrobiaceae bacterium]
MEGGAYAEWLQRGRVHQWENRPVDAMLCFQRAASLAPSSADARFLLGEVNWQLGRIASAVAAWREAARIASDHLAPQLALSEALLALGDVNGAFDAAREALRIAPSDRDANVLHAISAVASGRDANAMGALSTWIAGDVKRLAAAAPGGTLANVLVARSDTPGASEVLAALVPHVETIAFALLVPLARAALEADAAGLLRDARDSILRAALERNVAERDIDVLRSLATEYERGGQPDAGRRLASRYAQACVAFALPGPPLDWPRRPAPPSFRVQVLLAADNGARAVAMLARIAAKVRDVDWTLLMPAGAPIAIDEVAFGAPVVRNLPNTVDAVVARAIAQDAPDVLIDTAGLRLASGPMLALHPAPVILAAAVDGEAHAPPLVDDVLVDNAAILIERLEAIRAQALRRPRGDLSAAEVLQSLDAAIDAHRNRSDDAIAIYDRILADQPDHAQSLHLLALIRRDAGDGEEARELLERALARSPMYIDARAAAARLARDNGRIDEGMSLVDAGLAASPRSATLWAVKGEIELARHDGVAAEKAFTQALALRPTDAEAHYNFGVAMQKQRRQNDAARAYQRALVFDAGFADAHFNLGVLFQESGAGNAAISAYRAVLERDPRRVAAYRNLGEVLLSNGRIDEWLANFRRFETQCPDSLSLAVLALEACQYAADSAGLEHYLEGLRHERFDAGDAFELVDSLEQLLYLLLFFDVEPQMLHRFAKTYDATAPKVYGARVALRDARLPGRIRIGYLSADFRNHVMGKMMWQAIRHHDRDRFAVHCYSLSSARDDWTERFAAASDSFVDLHRLDERDAALRIAEDDIDVLVDLSGHTRGGKPGILALKPARVQITHVASAGSVGLKAVDFKLTDDYADIPANQETMIEQMLSMQGCVYPWRHVDPAGAHPFTRTALGLAADAVVIGAFVSPMKLSRRCLSLWREILVRIPRAKLALSPMRAELRPVLERVFAAGGITHERLVFFPQGRDDSQNLARYASVDFVLDPMPFGGVNGVIEPLDAGVPVVTLLGKRHGERSAYSILANLGVRSTVAHSGREYVELAVRLADDREFMRATRSAIKTRLADSVLVDMVAHTRHLEAAYLRALELAAPQVLEAANA